MASQDRVLPGDEAGFSLVLGGPLYRLYRWTGMARQGLDLVPRRILAFVLICWLPPLVLSLFAGRLTGGVSIPFLFDAEAQIRCLVVIPLLVGSELFVHRRVRIIVGEFLEREIVAEEDRARFTDLVASAARLRDSVLPETFMLFIAAAGGYWAWTRYAALDVSTWYQLRVGAERQMTAAGFWYAFVSLSILRFLILRWYFRLFIWYRVLWRVRSLPLQLNYFHPDRAAGLGFLEHGVFAFAPVLVAQSVAIAATLGNRIWHLGARLTDFETEILGVAVALTLIDLVPLCFFSNWLIVGRRTAWREFGVLASRYVNAFRSKWISGPNSEGEALLGTSDIQSLADLANSYQVIEGMRILPFSWIAVIRLLILIVLPMASLILTAIPLVSIVEHLMKLAL